jgi:D-alanine-D-alanine ligase-like ATP-grasp enzyme
MKILAHNYYHGPSIVGNFRALRWVIKPPDTPLELGEAGRQARVLFIQATGREPDYCGFLPSEYGAMVLAFALALQRARYHPVCQGTVRILEDERIEVAVEVVRSRMVEPLARSVAALLDEACGIAELGTFADTWKSQWHMLGFSLTDLFLYDRLLVARRLGVPYWHDGARRLFLGDGCHARLIKQGFTEASSYMGNILTADKEWTNHRLAACGMPVPDQIVVKDVNGALIAARKIGYPVVLKPRTGNKGYGVTSNLLTDADVRGAFTTAARIGRSFVVERYLAGDDYRFLVIKGRYVAALKRLPPQVVGDGVRTVSELLEWANRHERRDGVQLFALKPDEEMRQTLSTQGLGLASVPEPGRQVILRSVANLTRGGTTEDVTDEVHHDNRTLAVKAARACLLDVAGVDFVTPDVRRSWREGEGGIIEVNAGPGVDLHMLPTRGRARDVSWHMIRTVRPAADPGIVPRFVVAGEHGKHAVSSRVISMLRILGLNAGLLDRSRVVVNGQTQTLAHSLEAAKVVFTHPDVQAVVVQQSMKLLATAGSRVERYSVAVMTDDDFSGPGLAASLGEAKIGERLRELLVRLACVVVIDARHAGLWSCVTDLPARQAGFVGLEEQLCRQSREHLRAGGWSILVVHRNGDPWLAFKQRERTIFLIPAGRDASDKVRYDAMAAAALIGAGHSVGKVAQALRQLYEHERQGSAGLMKQTVEHEPASSLPVEGSLDAASLEQFFNGAWVNFPGPGWTVDCVVLGSDVRPGTLAVIDGAPDDLQDLPRIAAQVRAAWQHGASGVVAPLVPDDLPRWFPVLVCDNPGAGYVNLSGWANNGSHSCRFKITASVIKMAGHDVVKPS